jgi:hypothetical protein
MYLLAWIFIAVLVRMMDMVMGIGGAVAGGRGRNENENDSQFNSLSFCHATCDAATLRTGSVQIPGIFLWDESGCSCEADA